MWDTANHKLVNLVAYQLNVIVQLNKRYFRWIGCIMAHWVQFINDWTIRYTPIMNKWLNSIDVDLFLESIKVTLGSLLERYTGAEITDKLGSSILATVFRQLVRQPYLMIWIVFLHHFKSECWIQCLLCSWQMILLLELCFLDIPHSILLKSFSSMVELLKSLSSDTGDIFSKVSQLWCSTYVN